MRKNLPSALLIAFLLLLWQGAAMGINAAYILPSPVQILVRLWELREPLFLVHLPATMGVTAFGLFISIALGLLLAVSMDWNPKLGQRRPYRQRQLPRCLYSGLAMESGARCL